MDIYLQGRKVRLTPAEFKAQGGEGAVYVKDRTAYKIYADPAKMIPPAKIAELSALTLPDILRPADILYDARRVPVGYTMPSVADARVLCQTFPKAFRERVGLTQETMLHLVQALQMGVAHVHAQGILIVDLNEMNFLVDTRFEHVYFIDVDSYQTPSYNATALMDSVRDRHAQGWNAGTDWFSFAVVSFQMFVGIHPYKGKHPVLKTLDERMCRNLSVLHPDVSVPAACLPFEVIPKAYLNWYRAVLENGRRLPPPTAPLETIAVAPSVPRQTGSSQFTIEPRLSCAGTIVAVTRGLVVTTEDVYLHSRKIAEIAPGTVAVQTPQTGRIIGVHLENGMVRLTDLTSGQALPGEIAAEQLTVSDGRLYVKHGGALHQISFVESASRLWPQVKTVGAVLENATQLFEGVALQTLLGAWYASLLPEHARCHQVRLPELDGGQVLDARFESGILMVSVARAGRLEKWVFRFASDYAAYDARVITDLDTVTLNFTVLDSGLCLHLTDEDELELFPAQRGGAGRKALADPALRGDCRLFHDGPTALFARGETLFRFVVR